MDNGFSVLMLIFGAALLLYAAVLSGGNHKLLPYRVEQTMRKTGRKKQTKLIAKITAIVALSPVIGGLLGLTPAVAAGTFAGCSGSGRAICSA